MGESPGAAADSKNSMPSSAGVLGVAGALDDVGELDAEAVWPGIASLLSLLLADFLGMAG